MKFFVAFNDSIVKIAIHCTPMFAIPMVMVAVFCGEHSGNLKNNTDDFIFLNQDNHDDIKKIKHIAHETFLKDGYNKHFNLPVDEIFPFNSYTLSDEGKIRLAAEATYFKDNNVSDIFIVGYADQLGSAPEKQRISLQRAITIRDEIKHTAPAIHIIFVGLSDSFPIVTNTKCHGLSQSDMEKCLKPNRRVEIWYKQI